VWPGCHFEAVSQAHLQWPGPDCTALLACAQHNEQFARLLQGISSPLTTLYTSTVTAWRKPIEENAHGKKPKLCHQRGATHCGLTIIISVTLHKPNASDRAKVLIAGQNTNINKDRASSTLITAGPVLQITLQRRRWYACPVQTQYRSLSLLTAASATVSPAQRT
jgi:hypothetical protein